MATFEETGSTATDRLREAEMTLDRANTLLGTLDTTAVAVEGAAARIDTLITEEGAPLLAEMRVAVADATQAIALVTEAAETDLPGMIADIRRRRPRHRRDRHRRHRPDEASGRCGGCRGRGPTTTLAQVTETFANANDTLGAINGALETGERTLVAAESALTGADALINDEIATLVDRTSTTVSRG
jgi:phospholipid/cholesterol/gamma-HCH transport system substrate-binding protein